MITFEQVAKTYPEFDIFVDLTIENGELVSILGPSGSGKTTTLRLIAGFEKPDSGIIRINEEDVTNLSPADRGIGYVFQDYTLFPHMNVAQNVAYGLRVRRYSRKAMNAKVAELLDLVELPGYDDRDIATLSGGERQRVAIARALAVDPVLLLLDEPFSSIDEVLRRELREEIVRLQQRLGITVVFVTHSRQEALAISDRIALLRQGRVIQYDTAETVYRQPANQFVAEFVGEANWVNATAASETSASAAPTASGPSAPSGSSGASTPPGASAPTGDFVAVSQEPLLFRPEQMQLYAAEDNLNDAMNDTAEDGATLVSGTIRTHEFLGHTHRYGVEIAAQSNRRWLVLDQRRLQVGTPVSVAYRRDEGYHVTNERPDTALVRPTDAPDRLGRPQDTPPIQGAKT